MAPNSQDILQQEQAVDPCFLDGHFLANPPPGEEICISGISGVFPNSRDVHHFRDNLFNKVDMVDGDCRRWEPTHSEIPQRTGKIIDIDRFDAGYFGIHERQAHSSDAMVRIFLEKSIEAIFDAGMHPSEMEGTKTGVFVGSCFSESEKDWFFDNLVPQQFGMTGCQRSMIPNRVSYFLKLKGPSIITDTACSSSLYALEHAYRAMRKGLCDMAIVGGTNLTLHPFVSLQFARLGVLSQDGCCKSFDQSGNGYARSEAISCVLLRKTKDCRRIYAKIVHAKTSCDGYKEQGITFPSGEMQKKLLQEFYLECGVDSKSLSFLEGHGTGTIVGDPEEANAIDEIFCTGRETPLLIGSVKSNIGHTEPASGLCSITKCVIGFEEGIIPPNLHYSTPRDGVKALEEGRIKVVTEKTPFQDDRGLIGVNSFGFGGGNCHILLNWNTKTKVNGGSPRDDLPRLVCVSGRTAEAITTLTDDVNSRKLDAEHVQLLHEIFRKNVDGHTYRGYTIVSKFGEIKSSLKEYLDEKSPLVLAFGNFGDSWQTLCHDFFSLPIFAAAIQRVHNILIHRGVNIMEVIQGNPKIPQFPVLHHILGNMVLQIGIIDILNDLEVKPHAIMGYALGELSCAYFDGSLTLEQIVLISYEIGIHLQDINKPSSVYVVKLGEGQVRKLLPTMVDIIWKNSNDTVTISGDPKVTQEFVATLKDGGVDVFEIGSTNVTLHSKKIAQIEPSILPKLKKVIGKPKQRDNKWLSASTERVSSPEYFVKALHSQVFFQDVSSLIIKNAVVLEIGLGDLSKLLKHTVPRPLNIVNFDVDSKQNAVVSLLDVLGRLYEYGVNPQVQKLYPKIQYPVSRGTPMIAPKIRWNHSKSYHVIFYRETDSLRSGERSIGVTLKAEEWQYISGHIIDGRNLFPATGYLYAVWETLGLISNVLPGEMIVVFENCKFNRATHIGKEVVELTVMIQQACGNFEVIEGNTDVVSGRMYFVNEDKIEVSELPLPAETSKADAISLKTKDIYKELRLRGYNYKGAFRGLQECDCNATKAWIKWDGNWVSFLDTMLQIKILQIDTRHLYVPTSIKRMTIDAKKHLQYVETFGENPILPVYVHKDAGVIKCGGIEIRGLMASSIPRRKPLGQPVLEKYEFVPNELKISLDQSLRVNMQIGLENLYAIKVKVVEVLDEATKEESEPLGPKIFEMFADQPLIQSNVIIFSKKNLELPNVTVEDKKLISENDCNLIVGTNIFKRTMVLQQAFGALKEKGFILSREDVDFDLSAFTQQDLAGIDILTVHNTGTEKLLLFRKTIEPKELTVINVSNVDEDFTWLPLLQTTLKNDSHVIIYAQNEELNGLMGLFNCIRREPGGMNVRCFLIYGQEAPSFDPNHPFYLRQIGKNMAVNIYKGGQWGTYRHTLLEEVEQVQTEHCFVNALTRGDISTLSWIEGDLTSDSVLPPENTLVDVYYASLNFRDIMTASGRINADVITMDRRQQECVQGFEFCGRNKKGKRVMGMVSHGALSTLLEADSYMLWDVPDCWTMEEASTVPVVYSTVIYALLERGKIRKGDSILIHSGTGGVGQAAITLALSYGCAVYTTVSTPEKRDLIKKLFPQLTDRHIGSSRDITFEQMVKRETKGRGVDIVLNSLSEEKLLTSVRCLARGGKFLEIGKFDLANNNRLGLMLLEKECSFHGVMLDQLFKSHPSNKKRVGKMLTKGIELGAVKPLAATVFQMNEVEQAFRFMAGGKHTGKVVIQIRKEEPEIKALAPTVMIQGVPRFTCNPEKSCVIVGGLGGFGLELADWLIIRGATRLVLTSRTGIQTGYQFYRLNIWKSYGVDVVISTSDITTREGCEELISEAEKLGPIQSIFNLAVVLKDSLLENQSPESFRISFGPKPVATKYLDEITRDRCPQLRDFVIFSSVSCGRGNAGQTNYGMANSIMERICEQRRREGFPALAIEWGAVGDVGLVAEMLEEQTEMEIGGTLQQRITSCLQVMDKFLRQKQAAIVSSMVVAEKRSGSGGADNIVDAVANILGIKKQSVSPHATLAELGMDSMTAVEIKQTLEREFEVFLTAQDIRSMTFARLQEIQQSKESDREAGIAHQRLPTGIELILRYLGDEATSTIPIIRLPSLVEDDSNAPYVFCFPGIEGFATTLKPMAANVAAKMIGIQFCYKHPTHCYKDLALESMKQIENYLKPEDILSMVAYSWGSIIALETMAMMEQKGYKGSLTILDGAPDMLMELLKHEIKTGSEAEFETVLLCHLMALYLPYEIILKNREKIYRCTSFDERCDVAYQVASKDSTHSPQYQKKAAVAFHTRIKELRNYSPNYPKIQSTVRLFKPSTLSVSNYADDYKLSDLCANLAEIRVFEGNHLTILENPEVADAINGVLGIKVPVVEAAKQQDVKEIQVEVQAEKEFTAVQQQTTIVETSEVHSKETLVDVITPLQEVEVKHI